MVGIISLVIGIVVLIRGQFRLAGRTIPTERARVIGISLIAPLIFEFCYSLSLVSQSVVYTAEGSVVLSQEAMNSVLEAVTPVQLIVLGAAITFSLYLIFSIPPDTLGSGTGGQSSRTGSPSGFFSRQNDAQGDSPATPTEERGSTPRGAAREAQRPKPAPQRDHPLGGFTRVSNPTAPKQPKSIMTLDEAAAYLHITREGVLALIDANKLPAARNNGTYAIARIAIDDYLADEKGTSTP